MRVLMVGLAAWPVILGITLLDATGAAAPRSGVIVMSKPEGADVLINGVKRGVTPLTLERVPGPTVQIEVRKAGYRTRQKQVQVREDKAVVVYFALSRTDEKPRPPGKSPSPKNVLE